MTSHRIAKGGLIDRSKALAFTFDGRRYQGVQGDTLASALLANGVRIMGRSFKYHRPRGPWGAWVDDPNAIMNVTLNGREIPNCQATTTPLEEGMIARSVNTWPSAQFDLKGGLDLFHTWLTAGFYYKTFMWPHWHVFEPVIRKMAGLGSVSPEALENYAADQQHARCETLVIGAGAAGLVAARTAAEAGQNVVLLDDHPRPGGGLFQLGAAEGVPTQNWITAQVDAIQAAGGRILTSTTAFGIFDHRMVGLVENGTFATPPRLWRIRAGRIILATGAIDRPVTFAGNDRPGIMALDGACEYLARYGVLAGQKIAVFSNNSLAEPAIRTFTEAGAEVTQLDPSQGHLRAIGGKKLRAVELDGQRHRVDTILTSGGMTPLVHLWRHAGGKLDWCEKRQAYLPSAAPEGITAIGAANGVFDLDASLAEARAAGAGKKAPHAEHSYQLTPLWPAPGSNGRQWIDFQHDVTLKDVELAARENYVTVEHLKRYTTLGMASDQGKTSNMAGLAAMAAIQGRPIPEVGTTTFRPPFVPVPVESFHGHHSKQLRHPLKRLPLEAWHRAANAALGEYGGWLRPGWYGSGIPKKHIQQEVLTARNTAGIFDGSPLGKIEVMGPDAEAFVNFVYYNNMKTLKPGHIRYGFMLTEGGIVFDDGVVTRLDQNRFLISCSSSHVDAVYMHLEAWRQDGNDPDRIFIHDRTQNFAILTVTGPKARGIVQSLKLDIDFTPETFAHMTCRECLLADTPIRISRVSFSGDASYEISVRRTRSAELWEPLIEAGNHFGAGLVGIEAMSIMRAEKGFIVIGKDTDGETMPHDLGFTLPRLRKKTAFVGDRSLHSDKANGTARKTLVGISVAEGAPALPTGAHLISDGAAPKSLGYVTSSYESPTLGHPIALGLLEGGADRIGDKMKIWHGEKTRDVTICSPCFLDPEGERLNAG